MKTERGGFVHLGVRQSRRSTSIKKSPRAARHEQAPGVPSDLQHDTPPAPGAPLSYGDEIEINGWRVFPAPWAWPNWWAVIPPAGSAIEAFLETDLDLAISAVLKSTGPAGYEAWRQLQLDLPEVGQ